LRDIGQRHGQHARHFEGFRVLENQAIADMPPPSQHSLAARSPRARHSRVTNGKKLVAGLDGRSAEARRYRDVAVALGDDLGGAAALSEGQRALVRQAAAMIVQSEKLQSALLRGELVDVEQLTRLANAATRILSRLGIKRQARAAPQTLADRLAAKYPATRLPGRAP
jgi:hypothetical protein